MYGAHRDLHVLTHSSPPRRSADLAMAGAEPAAEVASVLARLLAQRHAAEMGADADDDEPLGLLDARRIGLRIGQRLNIDRLGLLDMLLRPVVAEHRIATPGDCQPLAFGSRRKVDFCRSQCQNLRS